jgi:hypothetical protein
LERVAAARVRRRTPDGKEAREGGKEGGREKGRGGGRGRISKKGRERVKA